MDLDAATYSAIASAVSAACALFTLYLFRAQGKGFVWTKDHSISLLADQRGRVHIQIEVPLANLGKGNIKFIKLKAKKINLKTKAMDNFEMDMDEAYFPEGASIITYRTAIHTEMEADEKTKLVIGRTQPPAGMTEGELRQYQENLNKKIGEVPEHIVILKCSYKDGSWLGLMTRDTVIGLSIDGVSINYLSTFRRRELNEYFSW